MKQQHFFFHFTAHTVKRCTSGQRYLESCTLYTILLEFTCAFVLCLMLCWQVLTTTTWTRSSTSTWRGLYSTQYVGTYCWGGGETLAKGTVSSWPPTISTLSSTSSRWAMAWSHSNFVVSSSGVSSDKGSSKIQNKNKPSVYLPLYVDIS